MIHYQSRGWNKQRDYWFIILENITLASDSKTLSTLIPVFELVSANPARSFCRAVSMPSSVLTSRSSSKSAFAPTSSTGICPAFSKTSDVHSEMLTSDNFFVMSYKNKPPCAPRQYEGNKNRNLFSPPKSHICNLQL